MTGVECDSWVLPASLNDGSKASWLSWSVLMALRTSPGTTFGGGGIVGADETHDDRVDCHRSDEDDDEDEAAGMKDEDEQLRSGRRVPIRLFPEVDMGDTGLSGYA